MRKAYNITKNELLEFPFSHAVEAGGFLFLSAQPSWDVDTGKFVDGTIEEQFEQSFFNLENTLKAAGLTTDDVVKCTIFIKDMKDYQTINKLYVQKFKKPYPARTCVAVKDLPIGTSIEFEMIAYRG